MILKTTPYIICESYPEYSDDWDEFINNGTDLYYSNGFVLPSEKYDEYCAFLFDLLGKWIMKLLKGRYEISGIIGGVILIGLAIWVILSHYL